MVFYCSATALQLDDGFVMNDMILPKVEKFKAVNDRICYIEQECRLFNLVVINRYTKDKEEEVKVKIYEGLDNVCHLVPTNKVKILLGDYNVKIEQEIIWKPTIRKKSLHKVFDDNGTRLVNFAKNMAVSSTIFTHKNIHKQTWVSLSRQIKN